MTIAPDGSLVVRYEYKRNSYTVTFDSDGGSAVTSKTLKYEESYSFDSSIRTGYDFADWYHDSTKIDLIGTWTIADNLTLKAEWTAKSYTVTYDANGGAVKNATTDVCFDTSYSLEMPEKIGYTFAGWYNASTKIDLTGTWTLADNVTLQARWTANTDTPYKVEHYIETLDGTYELRDTDDLTGTSDSQVTPATKSYTGFTSPPQKTVTVAADGSLVVRYEYKRNSYTVTFDANGGSSVSSVTLKYGQSYDFSGVTKAGYTLEGWYNGSAEVASSGTWSITSSVTLKASWTANTDTPYKVEHYLEKLDGTYELKETDELIGTSDSEITPEVKTYIGFTSPALQTVTIAPDGSLVVRYEYTRNSYTVTFVTNGGNSMASQMLKHGEELPQAARENFTFGGWFSDAQLSNAVTAMPVENCTFYAYWQEENKPSDFTYSGTSEITITDYTASDTTVCIPSYIGGIPVTSIGDDAFYKCSGLTSVTIGNSVTSIGKYAFYDCDSLTSITIPNSVTSFGSYAFNGCYKLAEVIDHSSWAIFEGGSGYGYVAYYALEVHEGASKIVNQNDYLFYTYEGVNYLLGYVGTDTVLTLPENYNGQNYVINRFAFYDCDSLTSVTIPDSVTSIGDDAFYNCSGLTSVTIPNSVTSIGDWAFQYCYKLVEVINHSSLAITKGKSSYGYVAYYALEVHKGASKIVNQNDYLFYTYEGINYLFGYVGTDTVLTLPENYNGQNYEIYQYAFYDCDSLTSVTIGNGVTSIGNCAFYSCSGVTSIEIPASVTSIGSSAFYECRGLTSVMIGNGVTSIGIYAFRYCSSLTSITFEDTTTWWYCTEYSSNWQNMTGGTKTSVRDPSTNVTYFTTYDNYYWYKK